MSGEKRYVYFFYPKLLALFLHQRQKRHSCIEGEIWKASDETDSASQGNAGLPQQLRGILMKQKANLRPWSEVFGRFTKPATISDATKRVSVNIQHFQANYLLVSLILVLYCV